MDKNETTFLSKGTESENVACCIHSAASLSQQPASECYCQRQRSQSRDWPTQTQRRNYACDTKTKEKQLRRQRDARKEQGAPFVRPTGAYRKVSLITLTASNHRQVKGDTALLSFILEWAFGRLQIKAGALPAAGPCYKHSNYLVLGGEF